MPQLLYGKTSALSVTDIEPASQVHRISHDGIVQPRFAADVAYHDFARMHADARVEEGLAFFFPFAAQFLQLLLIP